MTRTEELWLEGGGFREAYTDDYVEQLEKLVRLQHEALLAHIALTRPVDTSRKAIEAFNKWENGE